MTAQWYQRPIAECFRAGVVTATVLSCMVSIAAAQVPGPPQPMPNVIVTSGMAVVKAVPDRAFISLATTGKANQPAVAQRQASDAMNAVQQKLRESGLPADAIRTTRLDLQAQYDYQNGKRVPRGYEAINAVEIRVDQIDRLGQMLDAVVASGVTAIDGIRFDLKDRESLEREALKRAVADARARADAAASGAGLTIDSVIRIEDLGGYREPPTPRPMMRAEMAAAPPDTPVAPGEIEVHARVSLTARIR
jgi:uncharacterized protein